MNDYPTLHLDRNDMGVNEHERPNFTLRQK